MLMLDHIKVEIDHIRLGKLSIFIFNYVFMAPKSGSR